MPLHEAKEVSVRHPAIGEHVEGSRRAGRAGDLADVVGVAEVAQERDLGLGASVGEAQPHSHLGDGIGVCPGVRCCVAPWVEGYAAKYFIGRDEAFVLQKVFQCLFSPPERTRDSYHSELVIRAWLSLYVIVDG